MVRKIAYVLSVLACILALSLPAYATITFDTSTGTSNEHTLTQSSSGPFSTTQTNDVLLAWVFADNTLGGSPDVSVSGGGITWTNEYSINMGRGVFYLFSAVATSKLNNATITVSTSVGHNIYMSYIIDAYSGCDTTSPIDQIESSNSGTSVSLTTGQNDTLAVGAMCDFDGSQDYGQGSGYTEDDSYCNFFSSDIWCEDEYANSETASSGTQVTVNWDVTDREPILSMIAVTLVAA